MDSPKYGCDDIKLKDDDSVVSEQCWQEHHRGDSRKWLVRDGFSKTKDRDLKSTMKATYPYPYQEHRQHLGKRRATVMQQLYEEAVTEVVQERDKPSQVEDYCTEYDGNFGGNVQVTKCENEEEIKTQLFERYPLYTSPAASFWNFKIEKYQKSNAFFPGLTMSVDLKNPFKRHSGFTKPISEVLDECSL